MKKNPSTPWKIRSGLFLFACAAPLATQLGYSQDNDANDSEEDVFTLSPFEVTAGDGSGYKADSSLAGTRIKTELKDIASSISVITNEFLKDTGATDNQSLLTYTTNTEVGGVGGNFTGIASAVGNASDSDSLLRPNSNTRVRGLAAADNTRDYFKSEIPWDGYNIERVELQRGPNSILFGLGSPAGIINTSTKQAFFGNESSVELKFGSFESMRVAADINKTIIEDQLAVRVNLLNDSEKFRQKPAHEDDSRINVAVRYAPSFLNNDSMSSNFKAVYEAGEIKANRPHVLPPEDRITPFFDSDAINQQTWDPYYATQAGIVGYSENTIDSEQINYWISGYPGPGMQATANPIFVFDGAGATAPSSAKQGRLTTYFGIQDDGSIDKSISGIPFGSMIGIAGFSEYATNANRKDSSQYPGAASGFWKNKSLTDTSIFDFYNILLDGPNKKEWQDWTASRASFDQTFLNGKLGYEVVFDRQSYNEGWTRNLQNSYISVDIRENLMYYPWAYDEAVANPNAGRAFVGSSTRTNNGSNKIDRETRRITAFAEIDFRDILGDNALGNILGSHMFNGIVTNSTKETINQSWTRYALSDAWTEAWGDNAAIENGLIGGATSPDLMTYLSSDLRGTSSASGLNLPGITAVQSLSGTYSIDYFNSNWNSTVDPAAAWTNPTVNPGNSSDSTQSENPLNYVGWTSANFSVVNADNGINSTNGMGTSRVREALESKGVTWQAKLLGGNLVPTWGYRESTLKSRSGDAGDTNNTDLSLYQIPEMGDYQPSVTENSTTWGAVLHSPQLVNDMLPWDSSISLFYNEGENAAVEQRYGFDGKALPNQQGNTEEYGIVLSTMKDRLKLKATHYTTRVKNANLSSVSSETATLGNNTYWIYLIQAWGTAAALTDLAARQIVENPDAFSEAQQSIPSAQFGHWGWGWVDGNTVEGAEGLPNAWDWDGYTANNFENTVAHPDYQVQGDAIDAWLNTAIESQEWYDAYGFDIDVAAAKAGDWQNLNSSWVPGQIGDLQAAGRGRINGYWPTALVDYVSEGWEYELVGSITDNWNVSVNASKTNAYQESLEQGFVDYMEGLYEKYVESDAGDIRIWWAGHNEAVRREFVQNLWGPYQFQVQTNGRLVSELSPWSVNAVTNYSFHDGKFAGLNIGGGFRWKDKKVIGYQLNDAEDNLDPDKPIWSDTEQHFDLWAGKTLKLNDRIDWRIQVNLRNVGEDPGLKPLSVQPDGSPAAFSIQEGMTWQLTNTFSF